MIKIKCSDERFDKLNTSNMLNSRKQGIYIFIFSDYMSLRKISDIGKIYLY